jgi:HEAT repeat protein
MRPTLLTAIAALALGGCTGQPTPEAGVRVGHWVEALRAPDAKLRKEAAFKLGNLGLTDTERVVPALTGALRDVDAAVRREAIMALLKCGDRGKDAATAIAELEQRDPDPQVRIYARKALKKLRNE